MSTERRELASVSELVELLTLRGVGFSKFEGQREIAPEGTAVGIPGFGLNPSLSDDGLELHVDLFSTLVIEEAKFEVTLEVLYGVKEPIAEVDSEIMGSFLGRSTMVTCGPFLREAFLSLGQRLQVPPPIMDLVVPTDLTLNDDASSDSDDVVPLD